MSQTWWYAISLVGGVAVGMIYACCVVVIRLSRRVTTLSDTLDRVRTATYELSTLASDDIHDLQESLAAADIALSRHHQNERYRRRSMTFEESVAEFEATVARSQEDLKRFR